MLLSLGFGVLVDLDHLLDYWYSEKRICFDAREFMATRYWRKSGRIFILFHGFEYLPLLFLLWQGLKGRRWAMAATSAMASHVLADHFVNDLKPLGYFVLYRLAHRFRASEIIDRPKSDRREVERLAIRRLAERGELPLLRRLLHVFV